MPILSKIALIGESQEALEDRQIQKMQSLRIAATFGASIEEKREIYILDG
jgi:hypothetical protein